MFTLRLDLDVIDVEGNFKSTYTFYTKNCSEEELADAKTELLWEALEVEDLDGKPVATLLQIEEDGKYFDHDTFFFRPIITRTAEPSKLIRQGTPPTIFAIDRDRSYLEEDLFP